MYFPLFYWPLHRVKVVEECILSDLYVKITLDKGWKIKFYTAIYGVCSERRERHVLSAPLPVVKPIKLCRWGRGWYRFTVSSKFSLFGASVESTLPIRCTTSLLAMARIIWKNVGPPNRARKLNKNVAEIHEWFLLASPVTQVRITR